jgi:hypothetical protein
MSDNSVISVKNATNELIPINKTAALIAASLQPKRKASKKK